MSIKTRDNKNVKNELSDKLFTEKSQLNHLEKLYNGKIDSLLFDVIN